jgi:hypothetical protein
VELSSFRGICQWDYVFPMLENHVLEFAPNSSFDLLVVYFNQTHARSEFFLETVSSLYRLPPWFIMKLIYNANTKEYFIFLKTF